MAEASGGKNGSGKSNGAAPGTFSIGGRSYTIIEHEYDVVVVVSVVGILWRIQTIRPQLFSLFLFALLLLALSEAARGRPRGSRDNARPRRRGPSASARPRQGC